MKEENEVVWISLLRNECNMLEVAVRIIICRFYVQGGTCVPGEQCNLVRHVKTMEKI